MKVWLRIPLIAVILFSVSSVVWFLLGATAYFQRGMDIIGTAILWSAAVPVLLLVGGFSVLLIKGWIPTGKGQYVVSFIWALLSLLLSIGLIQSVSTHGWAKEKINSDSIKITADHKFEYRIDLINLFQRNSHARLYLKDVGSGEEMYIPVDIKTRKIITISVGRVNHWVMLEPTDNASHYILHTTEDLGIPVEKFRIDILAKTSTILK